MSRILSHLESWEQGEMKKTLLVHSVRLAVGGAFLAVALFNVGSGALGLDPGFRADALAAGVGGVGSFFVIAKSLHLFG